MLSYHAFETLQSLNNVPFEMVMVLADGNSCGRECPLTGYR
jgi:hypothetical protein